MDKNRRILVVDDSENIHEDFQSILGTKQSDAPDLKLEEEAIWGTAFESATFEGFEVHSAFQGEEAIQKVSESVRNNSPYAMAFVDVRMPPGPDGIKTTKELHKIDPDLQVVICTAYSDHTWHDITQTLGNMDRLLILKKPFDAIEVLQLASALVEKRDLIEQTKKLNEEMEQKIQERTQQLRLETQRANEMAEKAISASKAKGEFLANMSHEIRTPMNSIIGFGDLLQEEELTKTQKEYINMIFHSGKILLSIINDILDFSSIEAGRLKIDLIDCQLSEITKGIKEMFWLTAKDKQVEFDILEDGPLPDTLYTDPIRLRQCLINLSNNALKFTSEGHVYIRISGQDVSGKEHIRFEVEDTGIGIQEPDLERIFEAFSQVDGSSSRKHGGTGLGLAITKNIAQILGGVINVASEFGKGSTFTLLLPVRCEVNEKYVSEKMQECVSVG